MSVMIAIPVVGPLLIAAFTILAGRHRMLQRILTTSTLLLVMGCSVGLLIIVDTGGTRVLQAGGWPAPFGISLVADRLSVVMVTISSVVLFAVLVYAIGQVGIEQRSPAFHPVYLVLSAGVSAAFFSGDLFNLFVSFEAMLIASYVLLTLGGGRDQVRAGMTYVVISLIASTLFLITIAFVYTSTGTVNLAHLAEQLGALPPELRQTLMLLLLVVFGIKAAVFPLFFWLPDSYPAAPTAITAVFAGLLTKVGIYAIIRTQSLLLPAADRPDTLLLVIAGATMLVGVLGAIAHEEIKRILSFHIVSQIGYMVMGLGIATVAGVAGAIFYILHHIIVKTTLFLTGGLVEQHAGTGRLDRLTGLVRTAPLIGVLFLLPALSLAGIPPFSGFVAKLALVEAGFAEGSHAVVAVSLLVSLLTLFSMIKIWNNAFWGASPVQEESSRSALRPARLPRLMVAPTAALTVVSLAFALFAAPIYRFSARAATDLLDRTVYIHEVGTP